MQYIVELTQYITQLRYAAIRKAEHSGDVTALLSGRCAYTVQRIRIVVWIAAASLNVKLRPGGTFLLRCPQDGDICAFHDMECTSDYVAYIQLAPLEHIFSDAHNMAIVHSNFGTHLSCACVEVTRTTWRLHIRYTHRCTLCTRAE
ncbi:unnamed protein product [Ranitomeya imitator]|uniref:Uncharacterized protein n=1 Tax=Ranitomeya imitator TaxID=111125 RepID=A0ABN9KN01_9NEOB|nr:unnamed protein product [Ranitomeya imitator]